MITIVILLNIKNFLVMNIVTKLKDWQTIRKKNNKNIGFIHTMGHLHAGHLSLCSRSQAENDLTIVAIFVNEKGFAKIEIGLGRGKKLHDKRETIKNRDLDRDLKRYL